MISKGINDQFIKDTVNKITDENSEQDFFSAIKICKKKRIGPARTEDNRTLFYKKDILVKLEVGMLKQHQPVTIILLIAMKQPQIQKILGFVGVGLKTIY